MKAKQSVPRSHEGLHYVYVMDFASQTINKYRVRVALNRRKDGYRVSAEEITVEYSISSEFSSHTKAILDDIASIKSGIVIPGDVARSAYNFMFDSHAQNRVSNYIDDNLNIWQSIGIPAAIPLEALGKIVSLEFHIPVEFSDGSTLKVELTDVGGTYYDGVEYTFEYIEGSAKDSDGNTIPDSLAAAAPYVGVSSTQANAEALATYITDWFSGSGVSCTLTEDDSETIVTCKKAEK
jgi:hypothetical protein